MKNIVCIALMSLVALTANAQRKITGTITDEYDDPLPGATVVVKENKTLGTTADMDGKYVITLPDNKDYTLAVSYVGYLSQEVKVTKNDNVKDFKLSEDAIGLEQIVVTGTRTPKLLKDVPIVTRVFTADEIKKVDATHIGDLLETELPGIEFSYAMNQQVSLNLSGFAGNAVLFLVDGERLAGETLDNVDYNRLNMDDVGRIEIVKGAASSLYGSNAVGGVVNLISASSEEPWTLNVNARYGSHNDQRYGGTITFNAGKFYNSFNVQHTKVDQIDLDGSEDSEVSTVYASKTWNFKERLVYTPLDNLKITARAGYFFRQRDASTTTPDRYRDYSAGLKAEWDITDNDALEIAYSFDQYDKSDFVVATGMDYRDYSNVQNSGRLLYNHTFKNNSILTVGGDVMKDFLMSYQFEDNGDKEQYCVDEFVQYDWSPTEKFNIIAGLRFDYYSEADCQHVSPKLGLMYKVTNHLSLRGSYSGGFRAPTLKEMYMNYDMASIFMIYGNADLKPESSHNFQLSAEYTKKRFNVTVAGYYSMVDNRITTIWDDYQNGMAYVNTEEVSILGAEVNASAKFPCGFSTRVSYAYTHEFGNASQEYLTATRPHTATLRFEYDKKWKNYGFNIALSGRILAGMTASTMDTSTLTYNEVTYPTYTMWKLLLTQRIKKGINITATVDNLLNYKPETYYNNSPTTTGTTVSLGVALDIDKLVK